MEVKYLGNGEAVLVIGDGPVRSTSLDGGRTLTEVPQALGFRLSPIEHFEHEALLDEAPELDPVTGLPVPPEPVQIVPENTPPVVSRNEPQSAEQLQAEIDRLTAERDALAADEQREADTAAAGGTPAVGTPPTPPAA